MQIKELLVVPTYKRLSVTNPLEHHLADFIGDLLDMQSSQSADAQLRCHVLLVTHNIVYRIQYVATSNHKTHMYMHNTVL